MLKVMKVHHLAIWGQINKKREKIHVFLMLIKKMKYDNRKDGCFTFLKDL